GAAKQLEMSKEEIAELATIGDMRAPFSANVCEVVVEPGQKVAAGDRLIMLEAMKMQTPVVTEVAGEVEKISVKVGDAVKPGDKLVKLVIAE
ncbi:MAG: biotin/lipoyl-containing protein, partial [Thermodesulfobacteriota bacterium]|nr:biotin/lipoyl-containing protein [Thermodesulfobacteriota bacterium]